MFRQLLPPLLDRCFGFGFDFGFVCCRRRTAAAAVTGVVAAAAVTGVVAAVVDAADVVVLHVWSTFGSSVR